MTWPRPAGTHWARGPAALVPASLSVCRRSLLWGMQDFNKSKQTRPQTPGAAERRALRGALIWARWAAAEQIWGAGTMGGSGRVFCAPPAAHGHSESAETLTVH